MSNFFKKLNSKGILSLVEPSKEISKSYENKSENSLKAAKVLLKQNLVEESISMSYYSMYYRVLSLFFLVGIKSENHSATILLLKDVFGLENSKIYFANIDKLSSKDIENYRNKFLHFLGEGDTGKVKVEVEE